MNYFRKYGLIPVLIFWSVQECGAADPIRILPLGNSITQSSSAHYSYRYNLWKKLIDAEIHFDFVGSLNTNLSGNPEWPEYKGQHFDSDHEGHWGYRADEILLKLPRWLEGYYPDIVLLHIGHNDCTDAHSTESTVDEIKQIIAVLREKNMKVTVLLAKLIPYSFATVNHRINDLNSRIETIAGETTTPTSKVISVDQNTGFNVNDDTYDGGHPNENGEEKMAAVWFNPLSSLIFAMQDSLALAALYQITEGQNWENHTNWLTGPVSTWHGIVMKDNRVTEIHLDDNGLNGRLPPDIGNLSALTLCDLHDNQLSGSIPPEFGRWKKLEYLVLHNNQFTELPDLSGLPALVSLKIQNNRFTFEDIEPHIGIADFEYAPQDSVGEAYRADIATGDVLSLFSTIGGTYNQYQWFHNGEPVSGATKSEYQKSSVTLNDAGFYRCEISNSRVPDLTLHSRPIEVTVQLSGFHRDSLTLAMMYDSMGGPGWTNHTNWLTGPLAEWFGITLNGDRVTAIRLYRNNLTGVIPGEIGQCESLAFLDLSGNLLSGCPDFSGLPVLETLDIHDNRMTFEDIEPNAGIPDFIYAPQDSVGVSRDTTLNAGESLQLHIDTGGTANHYQWFRNGEEIPGADSLVIEFHVVSPGDSGAYTCEISNGIAADLILTSRPIRVRVSGGGSGISDKTLPEQFALHQNFPNPFNGVTSVRFQLPEASTVKIDVIDLNGRKIETLINESVPAGRHQIGWNASDAASGLYFIHMQARHFTARTKCLLIK